MKQIIKWLCLCSILIGLASCLDQIEFEKPETIENGIVIQGKMTKGNPSIVEVTVKKVFDFIHGPRFLRVKKVLIIDEDNNEVELGTRTTGKYMVEILNIHPFFKVEYGKGYKIRVEDFDNQVYESDFDYIFPIPKPKELIAKITEIEIFDPSGIKNTVKQISFFINTPFHLPDSINNSRILWEIEGVYKLTDTPNSGNCLRTIQIDSEPKSCYIRAFPFRNYLTLNTPNITIDSIDGINLYNTVFTNLFAEGYYFVVVQQSLSEAAFNYWSQVNLVVNRTGDVFQNPVGKIISNIKNIDNSKDEIFGFFYATEAEILRVYVKPEMAGSPMTQCPSASMTGALADFCCSCLELERSTVVKPEWWVE